MKKTYYFLLKVFLVPFSVLILQSAIAEQENETVETTDDSTVTDFLLTEVVPAFGGFEQIFLTNKPSFNLQFTQDGIDLKDCSLEFKLKQLETIQYQVTDTETNGFQMNMNIGQPRWLFFNASCDNQDTDNNTNHFNIVFSIKDENLEDSYYELGVNAFDKEQLTIKLYSIELGVLLEQVDRAILLSSQGDVMSFSEELEKYKGDGDIYSLPLDLWKPLNNKLRSAVQNGSDFIELEKVKITQTINVDGVVNLSFPTSTNGITQDTDISAPIKGQVFIPEEEEDDLIPVIDFSLQ